MKELTKNFLLLFCTLLVIFLLIEVALRVKMNPLPKDTGQMHILVNDSRVYTLNPNAEGLSANNIYHINSLGFRDYEFSLEKPQNTIRIAAIGDSYTFGKGVALEYTYPKLLQRKLGNTDRKVEVLNFGVYGYNTIQEYWMIKEKALAFNPDMIIILYTLNDPAPAITLKESNQNKIKLFLTEHIYTYRFLARAYWVYKSKSSGRIGEFEYALHNQSSQGWKDTINAFRLISEISKQNNITILLFIQPDLYSLGNYPFADLNYQVMHSAEQEGLKAFDLLPYFKNIDEKTLWIDRFEDRHPNEKGHEIIANAMFEILKQEVYINEYE